MDKLKNIAGNKFGRLIAIELCEKFADGKVAWLCLCDCGNYKKIRATHLVSGSIRSCGCLRKEGPHTTHGHSKHSRVYRIWSNMKTRCCNPNGTEYFRYGGRGISVCEEWKSSFESFYKWAMSNGYSGELSIDRKNNDKGYSPDNCKWATKHEQSINKSSNINIEFNGELRTVSEVAKILNVSRFTLYSRLNKLKWSIKNTIEIVPRYSNSTKRGMLNAFN